jgi:hypothetical protein
MYMGCTCLYEIKSVQTDHVIAYCATNLVHFACSVPASVQFSSTYYCCSYQWSDSVLLAERTLGRHSNEMREALLKLFEEPIPDSYKADKRGDERCPRTGPHRQACLILLFQSALTKQGESPCVWGTKDKLKVGSVWVVRTRQCRTRTLDGFCRYNCTYKAHTLLDWYILGTYSYRTS